MIKTIKWKKDSIEIIDQSILPFEEKYIRLQTVDDLIQAIKKLKVRGAPALGIAGAYGIVLGLKNSSKNHDIIELLKNISAKLIESRPTAVNLKWGINRVLNKVKTVTDKNLNSFIEIALKEANAILEEDILLCKKVGINGETLIKDGFSVLTHCNTGGLATGGFGTALGVLSTAHNHNKKIHVYVDETRPLLQGARLTTWELKKEGIDHTLICDNMAGYLMQLGKIDCVIVGADRIARNGDTANKIGTYSLAVLADKHRIPFYVAAPSSTIDPLTPDGQNIPIEYRNPEEVMHVRNIAVTGKNTQAINPAFDVTPASMISAIITEHQVFYGPEYFFK